MTGKIKAIVQPDRIEVSTDTKVAKTAKEAPLESVQGQIVDLVSRIDGIGTLAATRKFIKDNPDGFAETYSALRTASTMLPIELSKVNDILKEVIEDGGDPIVSEMHDVQWTLSEKKTTVTYDLDGLKEDHPDIYKKVHVRNGKPMKKTERKELDDKVEELEAQLEELRKAQMADDVAGEYSVNETALESLTRSDEDLAKYRIEKDNPRRLYFKNLPKK